MFYKWIFLLQKIYDFFDRLTLFCNRSSFVVEHVIAVFIAPKRQGNGLVLWIENSDQPSAVIHLNRDASTCNALLRQPVAKGYDGRNISIRQPVWDQRIN